MAFTLVQPRPQRLRIVSIDGPAPEARRAQMVCVVSSRRLPDRPSRRITPHLTQLIHMSAHNCCRHIRPTFSQNAVTQARVPCSESNAPNPPS
jgi:hypothetical protein